MSVLNPAVFCGSLSTSAEIPEENHTGKTGTEDATHDFRILSLSLYSTVAESVNWQINFIYRNTYSATSKLTSGNLFVLLSNSHYFVPCYVTITSVKLKFSFLVVVVSLVFSWIS